MEYWSIEKFQISSTKYDSAEPFGHAIGVTQGRTARCRPNKLQIPRTKSQ